MLVNILDILSILFMAGIIPAVWFVYKKKLEFFSGVFLGTFLFLLSFGCSVYSSSLLLGVRPTEIVINSSLDSIINTYNSVPGLSAEDLQMINRYVEMMREMYSLMLPAVLILGNLLWVYVIFMISKGLFAILRKDVSGFLKFSALKLPKSALFFAILSYALSVIFKGNHISYAFFNFSTVIFMVCSVCGLSVVDFAFRKKIKHSLFRAIIYPLLFIVLSVFGGIGGSLLMIMGIADAIFDFRKLKTKSNIN